jgi:flagellar protein FliS
MHDPRSAYLETQIKTATPQKLRLMLIDAAVRFAEQARQAHLAGDRLLFASSVERSREIVTELLGSIRPDPHPLGDAARALYTFVFQALAQAQLLKDVAKVEDALRVLEEERQTWQKVCELSPDVPPQDARDDSAVQEILAPSFVPQAAPASFSLEA